MCKYEYWLSLGHVVEMVDGVAAECLHRPFSMACLLISPGYPTQASPSSIMSAPNASLIFEAPACISYRASLFSSYIIYTNPLKHFLLPFVPLPFDLVRQFINAFSRKQ